MATEHALKKKNRTVFGALLIICVIASCYAVLMSPMSDDLAYLVGYNLLPAMVGGFLYMAITKPYRSAQLTAVGFATIFATLIITNIAHTHYIRGVAKDTLADILLVTKGEDSLNKSGMSTTVKSVGDMELKTDLGKLMGELKSEGEAILRDYQSELNSLRVEDLMDQSNPSFKDNLELLKTSTSRLQIVIRKYKERQDDLFSTLPRRMEEVSVPRGMRDEFTRSFESSVKSTNATRNEFWESQLAFADAVSDYALFLKQTEHRWFLKDGRVLFGSTRDLNEYESHWGVINQAIEREELAISAMSGSMQEKINELYRIEVR